MNFCFRAGILALACSLYGVNILGQSVPNIRFIHIGEELRPIGTLLISTTENLMPSDRPLDSIFGIGIKTDSSTFRFIGIFIKKSTFLVDSSSSTYGQAFEYKICSADNKRYYLRKDNCYFFFDGLKNALKGQKLDQKVIQVLSSRYLE